ncbi:MAG: hypothetical protein KJ607_07940, partial [Bacteroidetes bacterium]|nr:hypothetical protein [Bacteroidota bacterium]
MFKGVVLINIIFLLTLPVVYSADKPDSLFVELSSKKSTEEKAYLLNEISRIYLASMPDSAI